MTPLRKITRDEPMHPIQVRDVRDERAARLCLSPWLVARALVALVLLVALGALTLPARAAPASSSQPQPQAQPQAQLPSQPQASPRLRGDVIARGDVLTLGDLVEGVPDEAARRPLFRAPALGATGTIQARRIAEAAGALGVVGIETGGRVQVAVQRAARRVGAPEIEAAVKRALETGHGLDPRSLSVRLDGEAPLLLAPVDLTGPALALDVTYDPRSRRIGGLITLGERQASLRVTGLVVEMREVAVLARALNRGEAVTEADLAQERRPREASPSDAQAALGGLAGQVAQRALAAGAVLRVGDLAPPDLVSRGEAVTIVYETPGVSLSMRGQASEPGRLGATVTVVNVASKKVLQAVVVGPARVSVGPAAPQRTASAALDR